MAARDSASAASFQASTDEDAMNFASTLSTFEIDLDEYDRPFSAARAPQADAEDEVIAEFARRIAPAGPSVSGPPRPGSMAEQRAVEATNQEFDLVAAIREGDGGTGGDRCRNHADFRPSARGWIGANSTFRTQEARGRGAGVRDRRDDRRARRP